MTTIKSILLAASTVTLIGLFAATATTGCKDKSSCDAAIENTLKLMPKEMAEQAKGQRAEMLKKCEALPEESRKCAANAKSLEELAGCPK